MESQARSSKARRGKYPHHRNKNERVGNEKPQHRGVTTGDHTMAFVHLGGAKCGSLALENVLMIRHDSQGGCTIHRRRQGAGEISISY